MAMTAVIVRIQPPLVTVSGLTPTVAAELAAEEEGCLLVGRLLAGGSGGWTHDTFLSLSMLSLSTL
jgi:hypothetical protein